MIIFSYLLDFPQHGAKIPHPCALGPPVIVARFTSPSTNPHPPELRRFNVEALTNMKAGFQQSLSSLAPSRNFQEAIEDGGTDSIYPLVI